MEEEDQTFHYQSDSFEINTNNLGTHEVAGLKCIWSSRKTTEDGSTFLKWEFNWDGIETKYRIIGLTGELSCCLERTLGGQTKYNSSAKIELTEDNKVLEEQIDWRAYDKFAGRFDFILTTVVVNTEMYEEMFLPSDKTDVVLDVDGKKLNVNRSFLSFHSDFFSALFSNKFKEGSMNEIPINDVSFEEFGLLLSTIYPKTVFPNDRTTPVILELADRFLMPGAIHQVEHHLINFSNIPVDKKILMADKYGMDLLLKMIIRELDNAYKAKMLKDSNVLQEVSPKTKGLLLDKIITLF